MENSRRFVSAYNTIDTCLRNVYGYKASMTFSDMVRRTVHENYIIRMYEDDLMAFARLRNAIVHRSSDDKVIAEPHTDVTELIERIARLVSTPPLAVDSVARRDVITMRADTYLFEAVGKMTKTHYSNIPVYDERLVGVVNNKLIVECLGKVIAGGGSTDEFLKNTRVGDVLSEAAFNVYYAIAPATVTLDGVLNLFQKNRRLLAVIVTERGTNLERPAGIITTADILEINNILDNY